MTQFVGPATVKMGGHLGKQEKNQEIFPVVKVRYHRIENSHFESHSNGCFYLNFKKEHLVCFNIINCTKLAIKSPTINHQELPNLQYVG